MSRRNVQKPLKTISVFIVFCSLAIVLDIAAQEIEQENDSDSKDTHFVLPDMTVTGIRYDSRSTVLDARVLQSARRLNLGEALAALPGIWAVRRSAGSTEPVIRGLGWERVRTEIQGLPLYGACPGHMDPPASVLKTHHLQNALVVKGLPSVTLGPGGTGGRIMVSTDYDRGPDAGDELGGWIGGRADTSREGWSADAGLQGGTKEFDLSLELGALRLHDYESGDGIRVPADQKEYSGILSMGYRPSRKERVWFSLIEHRDQGIEYPALPMDSESTVNRIFNAGYRWEPKGESLDRLILKAGYSTVNHVMNNENKANRGMLEAQTRADADSLSLSLSGDFPLSDDLMLTAGTDLNELDREAIRKRRIVASGMHFTDALWPDTNQLDLGLFVECNMELTDPWDLRVGTRIDHVQSRVGDENASSLQGRTILENYIHYYGSEAADVDRMETLPGGNVTLEYQATKNLSTHVGAGLTTRAAGITERYFAFANAPGGYQIGDPSLESEKKYEVVSGLDYERDEATVSMTLYHAWFDDYILQNTIDVQDVNGDGNADLIKGFRNIDAVTYGAELEAIVRAGEHWSFPMSLEFTRGRNRSDGRDLPEIPPLETHLAMRYDYASERPWWIELGSRFVAKQPHVEEPFPEDRTSGFTLFNLLGGIQLLGGLKMELGLENLFDFDYNEHLTREAVFNEADLLAGDEVPGPGRSFFISLRYDF